MHRNRSHTTISAQNHVRQHSTVPTRTALAHHASGGGRVTTSDRISVNPNGSSVQIYFKQTYSQDSRFPLDPGDTCVTHVLPGGGVAIVPVRNIADVYPIGCAAPPVESVPTVDRDLLCDLPQSVEVRPDGDDRDGDCDADGGHGRDSERDPSASA